jgi:molecular chaperone HscB
VEVRSERNFFSFLGLPRKLNLDVADLEQRYRALSRQFHPDYFYNAPPAERRASLENTSYLNDAYRTLKNPVARIEYLLKLEGVLTEREGARTSEREGFSRAVPADLLEEVFALNEELDEIREARSNGASPEQLKARLERARKPIEAKRDAHEQQLEALAAKWDATHDREVLGALRERILERNYINNLLAGIERELTA